MPQNPIQQLTEALVAFRDDRDWKQFHNPKGALKASDAKYKDLAYVSAETQKGSCHYLCEGKKGGKRKL